MGTTKTIASCLVAAVLALDAVAGTVYVDNKLSDYTGHDGSSWQMAYRTIQEGVDAAASGAPAAEANPEVIKKGKEEAAGGKKEEKK